MTVSTSAVNASLGTYGSNSDILANNIDTFAPAGSGFGGGSATAYDTDNNISNDQFSINGGPPQTFDVSMSFNAVITYTDGTSANISAVVIQDTNGNTYWMPEFQANADQAAIEAKPVATLELVSPIYNGSTGQAFNLTANRQDSMPLCFTAGTRITCPDGDRLIDDLVVGDLVMTQDHGAQPIRWIGRRTFAAVGRIAPIKIDAGTLGATHGFEVSPQHAMLLRGPQAELLFGEAEVLAAAKHLVGSGGISIRQGGTVDYIHLLFDNHEIISANGVAAETLFLGETGQQALTPESQAEIAALFPELMTQKAGGHLTARRVLKSHEATLWVNTVKSQQSAA